MIDPGRSRLVAKCCCGALIAWLGWPLTPEAAAQSEAYWEMQAIVRKFAGPQPKAEPRLVPLTGGMPACVSRASTSAAAAAAEE